MGNEVESQIYAIRSFQVVLRDYVKMSGALKTYGAEEECDCFEEQEIQSNGTAKKMEEERGFLRSMADNFVSHFERCFHWVYRSENIKGVAPLSSHL